LAGCMQCLRAALISNKNTMFLQESVGISRY
jgi:hypothetical protein